MKIHRFYVPELKLEHDFWFDDPNHLRQWGKVLRFRPGQEVVLFDGKQHDRLYKITEISSAQAHVSMVTQLERKLPKKNVYLFWALLKKDKNDWVLQKATELGVSHFIPLLADRCDKTGFNVERAHKIVIEAAEQCGRSDIPNVREPVGVKAAVQQFGDKVNLFVCEQGSEAGPSNAHDVGVLIGPEGGWSDEEKQFFKDSDCAVLDLHDFTLRAETAALAAVTRVFQ